MSACSLPIKSGLQNLVRCAHNWNDGILEYWNNGVVPFGQINACGAESLNFFSRGE
jgi:hypothetical protein